MAKTDQNITLYRGDTHTVRITVEDTDISGAVISWAVIQGYDTVLTKTTSDDITITDGSSGIFEIELSVADTLLLSRGKHKHQAEIVLDGVTVVVTEGYITVSSKFV
jgi:hypothetical protein